MCIFCGSRVGDNRIYADAARELGQALARRGWGLVFGGGHVGLMGVVAKAAAEAGGSIVGVIPRSLVERELAYPGLEDLRIVGSMHERKALMAELSDAFLALPGGFGTADEFFEIVTWSQLGFHHKPIGLLNVAGFFDPLLGWVGGAIAAGFIKQKHQGLIHVEAAVEPMLDRLLQASQTPSSGPGG